MAKVKNADIGSHVFV